MRSCSVIRLQRFYLSVCFFLLLLLSGCGSNSSNGSRNPGGGSSQFTHAYVAFPPKSGTNNTHFMATVMTQPAIEGVTEPNVWSSIETGTPGVATCSPVGTDVCQMDASGWTHAYDWTVTDGENAQWFQAQGGKKKVNILLDGINSVGFDLLNHERLHQRQHSLLCHESRMDEPHRDDAGRD